MQKLITHSILKRPVVFAKHWFQRVVPKHNNFFIMGIAMYLKEQVILTVSEAMTFKKLFPEKLKNCK